MLGVAFAVTESNGLAMVADVAPAGLLGTAYGILGCGISFFLLFAYNLVVYAMRTGEIAVVAPFRYSLILLALPVGYWGWGDVPNGLASLGIGVVIAAGIYMLHREREAARRARAVVRGAAVLPEPAWERPIT